MVTVIVFAGFGVPFDESIPLPLNDPTALLVVSVEMDAVADVERIYMSDVVEFGFIAGAYETMTNLDVVGG